MNLRNHNMAKKTQLNEGAIIVLYLTGAPLVISTAVVGIFYLIGMFFSLAL